MSKDQLPPTIIGIAGEDIKKDEVLVSQDNGTVITAHTWKHRREAAKRRAEWRGQAAREYGVVDCWDELDDD